MKPNFDKLIDTLPLIYTAELCGVSVRSTDETPQKIKHRMFDFCKTQSPFGGEIEADESYVGAKRIRGKRGRGASGKIIVLIFSNDGLMFTQKLFQTLPNRRGKQSSEGKLNPIALFTRMESEAITAWITSDLISTIGSIMEIITLSQVQSTSTEFSRFGVLQNIV